MNYHPLGQTDLLVSPVALGCWGFVADFHWGAQADADSIATVHAALDAGINFFDTAESYGDGHSERVLGRALAGRRHQAVIASKVSAEHLAAGDLEQACEGSLRRLGSDTIDLYQVHWPSRTVPPAETVDALQRLQAAGKIRAFGVSNFGPGDLSDLLALAQPQSNQLPYSLLWRAVEFDLQPLCRAHGVGILAYSPLLHGLLAGGFATLEEMPDSRARTRHFSPSRPHIRHHEAGCEAETTAALAEIRRICREIDTPMPQVALAWLLSRPAVSAVVAGARRPAQAVANAAAGRLQLSPDVLEALDAAGEPVKQALGPNLDMWQSDSRYR